MTCSRGAGGAGGACLLVAAQYAGLDADADDGGLAMLGCSGLPLLDSTGWLGLAMMQLIASFIAVSSVATPRIPAQSKSRD